MSRISNVGYQFSSLVLPSLLHFSSSAPAANAVGVLDVFLLLASSRTCLALTKQSLRTLKPLGELSSSLIFEVEVS